MQQMKTYIQRFLVNAKSSPKTTAAGLAGLAGSITAATRNPSVLTTAEWWTVIFVSGGLVFAGDAAPSTRPASGRP
jgi:hypothetical protein